MHRLTQLAFKDYDWLSPPSGALRESEAVVRDDLARGGGLLASVDGRPVGCLRFEREPGYLNVRRVAVDPEWQRQGVGTAMMSRAHEEARADGYPEVRVGVRSQLPDNLHFYQRLGYRIVADHRQPGNDDVVWIELARPV